MKILRRLIRTLLYATFAILMAFILSNIWIVASTRARVFQSIEEIPPEDVGLVLGTSKRLTSGKANPYFHNRMQAAAELYKSGKIRHIIVSGDNRSIYYNEPRDMKRALVALGVPASAITLDYAGLRTLDSIVRCKEIFGQDKFIIVTQQFHSYRAIFIGRRYDIDATAYAAGGVSFREAMPVLAREFLARPIALVDLYILNTQPTHLGEKYDLKIE